MSPAIAEHRQKPSLVLAVLSAAALLAGCERPRAAEPVHVGSIASARASSNSYLIARGGEAVLVDAGAPAAEVAERVRREGLTVRFLVLMHGHPDHVAQAARLRETLGVPVLVHAEDAALLLQYAGLTPDRLLKDGERLTVGGEQIEVLHTPGHTRGSICLRLSGAVLTGDTLFRSSIGRTDLPGSEPELIVPSIRSRLLALADEVAVHPGHGESTTIGAERKQNPFLR